MFADFTSNTSWSFVLDTLAVPSSDITLPLLGNEWCPGGPTDACVRLRGDSLIVHKWINTVNYKNIYAKFDIRVAHFEATDECAIQGIYCPPSATICSGNTVIINLKKYNSQHIGLKLKDQIVNFTNVNFFDNANGITVRFDLDSPDHDPLAQCYIDNFHLYGEAIATSQPTTNPTITPTLLSDSPTSAPSDIRTYMSTYMPTYIPTSIPTYLPTYIPTTLPSKYPTIFPTIIPSEEQSKGPTILPSVTPSNVPSNIPTETPFIVGTSDYMTSEYEMTETEYIMTTEYTNNTQYIFRDSDAIVIDTFHILIFLAGFLCYCCFCNSFIYIVCKLCKKSKKKKKKYSVNSHMKKQSIVSLEKSMAMSNISKNGMEAENITKARSTSTMIEDYLKSQNEIEISDPNVIVVTAGDFLDINEDYGNDTGTGTDATGTPDGTGTDETGTATGTDIDDINDMIGRTLTDGTEKTEDVAVNSLTIRLWLKNDVQMEQYCDMFTRNGYESLDFIKEIKDEKDLYEIGIVSSVHRKKIMRHIEMLRMNSDDNYLDEKQEYVQPIVPPYNVNMHKRVFSEGPKHLRLYNVVSDEKIKRVENNNIISDGFEIICEDETTQ